MLWHFYLLCLGIPGLTFPVSGKLDWRVPINSLASPDVVSPLHQNLHLHHVESTLSPTSL
jgi:hypothetical protein